MGQNLELYGAETDAYYVYIPPCTIGQREIIKKKLSSKSLSSPVLCLVPQCRRSADKYPSSYIRLMDDIIPGFFFFFPLCCLYISHPLCRFSFFSFLFYTQFPSKRLSREQCFPNQSVMESSLVAAIFFFSRSRGIGTKQFGHPTDAHLKLPAYT